MDSYINQDDRLNLKQQEFSRIIEEVANDNWYELRFQNLGPDRRGYHSTFVHNKRY